MPLLVAAAFAFVGLLLVAQSRPAEAILLRGAPGGAPGRGLSASFEAARLSSRRVVGAPSIFRRDLLPGCRSCSALWSSPAQSSGGQADHPQAWSSSLSIKADLQEALDEAVHKAMAGLPQGAVADLAVIHLSSMYADRTRLDVLVDMLRKACPGVGSILGTTACGLVGMRAGKPTEFENEIALQLTLATLPDVKVTPFFVNADSVPGPDADAAEFSASTSVPGGDILVLYSTTSFLTVMTDFLRGLDLAHPTALKFGAIGSTVSSLTRPRVFVYNSAGYDESFDKGEGLAGIALSGDVHARSFVTQGARSVSPMFVCDKVSGTTVSSIRLSAEENASRGVPSPAMPPLAAIRQIQKMTSDPQEALLIQRNMLVGTEAPSSIPASAAQMQAMVEGTTERFLVRAIGRANMKDGSITLPGESLQVGQRLQFFVRDRVAAASDLDSSLAEYKRRELEESLGSAASEGGPRFTPVGALMFPCFDRGYNLFREENYESSHLSRAAPVPISGFFCNGVLGPVSEGASTSVFGTSTGVVLFSPRSRRPVHLNVRLDTESGMPVLEADEEDFSVSDDADDFAIERRDVSAGRAVQAGEVKYSVAEKTRRPRSRLEAMVWHKEAEVDRERERMPITQVLSRMKTYMLLPQNATRDLHAALQSGAPLKLIPEVKGASPTSGIFLEEGYDAGQLAARAEAAGATAVAVHTDAEFFGAAADDMEKAKASTSLPVICSDLIVYPYQIYTARLGGADAIRLVASAMSPSDLPYFYKVARAVGLQVIVVVSSAKQLEAALQLKDVQMISITNRNLATWVLDPSRAERLLSSSSTTPEGVVLMIEGGLNAESHDWNTLKSLGVQAVIVGEGLLSGGAESYQESVTALAQRLAS